MVIGRELYSQTYYYNTKTKEVTAKGGSNKGVVDYLNGKGGSKDSTTLDGYEREQKTLIEAFLEMQNQGWGNPWDRFKPVEGEADVYEFTYTKNNDLEGTITMGGRDVFQQKATFILPGAVSGKWDFEYPEKMAYNKKTNSATITQGDTFTLKNGYEIVIGRNGAEVSKESYGTGTSDDDIYAQEMADLMTEFIKTANRGCLGLSVSAMSEEQVQELTDMLAQTGVDLNKKFSINGTIFAEKNNTINIVGAFAEGSKVWERESSWRHEAMKKLLYDEFGISEKQLEKEMSAVSGVPGKWNGAPYGYLANGTGIIEYNGVVFTCDDYNRQLCLGDMSKPEKVIRIPMSEGGCLLVNRDNIGDLQKAIGMFSPEDINLIMRALRLDAKIQEMEKEIEEMEDGIGKSTEEEHAADAVSAEQATKDSEKANGFLGYENEAEDSSSKLTESQLDMLTQELVDFVGNKERTEA